MVPMLRHSGDPRLTLWPFFPTRPTSTGETLRPTHRCEDEVGILEVFCHLPVQRMLRLKSMIFVKDWVMFSICSSRNIGSTSPFHSKLSILYGTNPRGHKADGLVRKAPNASPVPTLAAGEVEFDLQIVLLKVLLLALLKVFLPKKVLNRVPFLKKCPK